MDCGDSVNTSVPSSVNFKGSTDIVSYSIDWSDSAPDGVWITDSSWSAAPAGLTLTNEEIVGQLVTKVLVGDGVEPTTYVLTNTVVFSDGQSRSRQIIINVTGDLLVTGVNSFATYSEIMAKAALLPDSTVLLRAEPENTAQGTLEQAWRNIALMKMNIVTDTGEYTRVEDLTAEVLAELPDNMLHQLINAQMLEADSIIGGSPLEDRRRAGLLSDTTGESGHFLRTAKPIDLPIYRRTALALVGLIDYSASVLRAS